AVRRGFGERARQVDFAPVDPGGERLLGRVAVYGFERLGHGRARGDSRRLPAPQLYVNLTHGTSPSAPAGNPSRLGGHGLSSQSYDVPESPARRGRPRGERRQTRCVVPERD